MNSRHLLFIFAFFMGIFYRDFSYIGIQAPVPGGKLYITEIFIAVFIVFGLVKYSILRKFRQWITLKQSLLISYFCFSLSAIIALVYSNWSSAALTIREFASYYYSFFFFLPIFLFKEEKYQDVLVRVIFLATLFAYILIIYRLFMGLGILNSTGEYRYGNYEIVGILILITWLFIRPLNKWNLAYWLLFIVSIIITLVLINHRSATIALLFSIFIVNYLNYSHNFIRVLKKSFDITLIVCIFALPFILFYKTEFYASFERLITIISPTEEENASWRLFLWKFIFSDMNVFDFLIGKGWGWQIPDFQFNYRTYSAEEKIVGFHNSLLFYFYHLGFFGIGTFLVFLINIYKNAIKEMKNCSRKIQFKVNSLIAANLGILVFSLFNVVLEGPYMSFFFWITLGMIYNYPNLYNQRKIIEN